MSQMEEMKLEAILSQENVKRAWAAVKRNEGAAGVDRKTIDDTKAHLKQHWPGIREQVVNGSYQPAAVRAVEIPKASGGSRMLGIPTVQDRLLQQALHQILSEVFEPQMSQHSARAKRHRVRAVCGRYCAVPIERAFSTKSTGKHQGMVDEASGTGSQ